MTEILRLKFFNTDEEGHTFPCQGCGKRVRLYSGTDGSGDTGECCDYGYETYPNGMELVVTKNDT